MDHRNALIFVCSRTTTITEKRLAHRIAMYLQDIGEGQISSIRELGEQRSLPQRSRRKMIFINDCQSACVKLLTHGFDTDEYLYIDVSNERNRRDFDVASFCAQKVGISSTDATLEMNRAV